VAKPTFEQVMTGVVGGVLLAAFLAVVVVQLVVVKQPPRVADVAPSVPPQLICPAQPPPGDSVPPASTTESPKQSPTAIPTPGASPTSSTSAPLLPAASPTVVVTCAANEVTYTPQFRGSFDPAGRLTALLAIVAPLVTSIVAFYFGQKAGSSDGRAATAEANAAIVQAQQSVKDHPSLPQADKTSLVDQLEQARVLRK
jgi:hypothetical protein